MKVLHTSDWHLGKKLYKKSRHEEHCLFLDWLKTKILEESIDILVVAGDIFDTPRPPTSSLKIYFDFLHTVTSYPTLKQVLIISGNHDSGHFLEAPSSFLAKQKIKVVGSYYPPTSLDKDQHQKWQENFTYNIKENHTNFRFALMPFFKVSDLISSSSCHLLQEEELTKLIHLWQQNLKSDHDGPSLIMAHHLFGRYQAAGSEQTVSLSGLDSIAAETFRTWDILALGHIHRRQVISKQEPLAIYCGSPIAMRFSESQKKSVVIYNYEEESKKWSYRYHDIPVFRFVKRQNVNEANYQEMFKEIEESSHEGQLSAFIELTVKCKRLTVTLIDNIRKSALDHNLELLNIIPDKDNQQDHDDDKNSELHMKDLFELTHLELFDQYLEHSQAAAHALQGNDKECLLESFQELYERHQNSFCSAQEAEPSS
jgi:exonuclease SbcD